MPIMARAAEIPNLITPNFPATVFHRDLDLIACHIAGTIGKLHMSSIIVSGVIGAIVSITIVI